jgi:hypothetical protein
MVETKQSDSKNTFEIIKDEEDAQKIKKNELALKYLKVLGDPICILRITQSLNALKYTIYFAKTYDKSKPIDSWIITEYQAILIEIYLNLMKSIFRHNDYAILNEILAIFKHFTENSKEFCQKLSQPDEVYEILFNLLNNIELDGELAKNKLNNEQSELVIVIILNLSRFYPDFKEKWDKQNAVESLNKISAKFNNLNTGYEKWYSFLALENLNNSNMNEFYDSSLNFASDQVETREQMLKRQNVGIKYLKFLNEPATILNCLQSMNFFYFINDKGLNYDDIDPNVRDTFVESIINLVKYLIDCTIEQLSLKSSVVDFINIVNSDLGDLAAAIKPKKKITEVNLKKHLLLIVKLTEIIQALANESVKFCIRIHKISGAIKMFFEFIRNEIVSDYLIQNLTKKMSSSLLKDCYEGIIGCIHNLSRVNYRFRSMWNEFDAVKSCIRFSEKLGPVDPHYRFYVYMILANIATDEQIDTLQEIKVSTQNITELIKACSDSLENKERTPVRVKVGIELFFNIFEI